MQMGGEQLLVMDWLLHRMRSLEARNDHVKRFPFLSPVSNAYCEMLLVLPLDSKRF